MHFKSLYFDLDDTLYPASSGLWDAIRERMNTYMQKFIDLPIARYRQHPPEVSRNNMAPHYGVCKPIMK